MRDTKDNDNSNDTLNVTNSADESGEEPAENYGARRSGRGPGAQICSICFCLFRSYNQLSIVQINPLRPSLSYSATDSQSFRFSVKIFSRYAIAGGGGPKNLFHWDPDPLPAAPLKMGIN